MTLAHATGAFAVLHPRHGNPAISAACGAREEVRIGPLSPPGRMLYRMRREGNVILYYYVQNREQMAFKRPCVSRSTVKKLPSHSLTHSFIQRDGHLSFLATCHSAVC